jgi:hypothetical protein
VPKIRAGGPSFSAPPSPTWWTAVQAAVWIVTGSENMVARVERPGVTEIRPGYLAGDSWDRSSLRATVIAAAEQIAFDGDRAVNPLAYLAESCRQGKVRARGFPLGQGSPEDIGREEWEYLTIIDAEGRSVRAAYRAGADDDGIFWTDLRFRADDVRAAWAAPPTSKRDLEVAPTVKAAAPQVEPRQRPPGTRATQAEHDHWFIEYRDALAAQDKTSNSKEDEAAGKLALGARYDRIRARDARRRLVRSEWTSTAKRRGKR